MLLIAHPKSLHLVNKNMDHTYIDESSRVSNLITKHFSGRFINLMNRVDHYLIHVAEKNSDSCAELVHKNENNPLIWMVPFTEKLGSPPRWMVLEAFALALVEYANTYQENDLVVVTSSSLLVRLLNKSGSQKVYGGRYFKKAKVKLWLKVCCSYVYGILEILSLSRISRKILGTWSNSKSKGKAVLLRSFADHSYISVEGKRYEDIKLKGFQEFYESHGYKVLTELNLSGIKAVGSFLTKIRKLGDQSLLIGFQALDIKDVIFIALNALKAMCLIYKNDLLDFQGAFGIRRILSNLAKYRAFLRVIESHPNIELVVFNWENKGYEKAILSACRLHYPDVCFIGTHNGVVSRFNPALLCWPEEQRITPFPHRILFCGRYMLDVFSSLYDICGTQIGLFPSRRHQQQPVDRVGTRRGEEVNKKQVLVILSYNRNLSNELLNVVLKVAKRNGEFDFILKPHPYAPIEFPTKDVPDCVRLTKEPLTNLLKVVPYVIYVGETTAVCEALGMKRNIAQFRPPSYFSVDVLNWGGELFPVFNEADELEYILDEFAYKTKRPESPYTYEYFFEQGNDFSGLLP